MSILLVVIFILRYLNGAEISKVIEYLMWWNYTVYEDNTFDFNIEAGTNKPECAFYKVWPEFWQRCGFLD